MIFKYLKKYKYSYLFGIITLFVVDILGLYIPQFTGELTDGLKSGEMEFSGVMGIIFNIMLIGSILAIGRFLWRFFIFGSARKIENELRNDMFKHLTTLSMRYYNEHKTGDLMAHFTSDLNAIRMSIGPAVITSFDAVIMTAMVVIKMIVYVNLKLTLLACIPMFFIAFGGVLYGKAIEKRFTEKQEAFSDMTDQVQESLSGIRVIKAFVQEQKEVISFAKANENNKEKNLSVVKLQAVVMPLLDVVIGLSSVITLLYGGYLVLHGDISLGKFVAFNSYIGMLVWPMIAAGDSITLISQGFASMKRVENIFKEEAEICDEENVDPSVASLQGEISIKHLSFRFHKELPKVLSDVSVTIPKGSTLAILGSTGSGKTAIANLLLRMYNVEPGVITIDGRDIREIPLHVLREQIAYVPQDNFLFSDSIQSNIAFGVRKLIDIPEEKTNLFQHSKERLEDFLDHDLLQRVNKVDTTYGDLEEVKNAAELACIHDNIMEFPRQYATMVGERGVTVSGGQKQRSSIARALMKEAPILILDDALSAVDTNTEEKILMSLKSNRMEKTTILIAHRISTIQNADKILVLEDGKVIEYGSHEELLALSGQYAKLYEKQQLEKQLEAV